jgi:hypothetical protein
LVLDAGDIETSTLNYVIYSSPTNGTLSGSAPNLTYTPKANFSGEDTMTYKVSDGKLLSLLAIISFDIAPVNDRPVATAINVSLPKNGSIPIVLSGTDIEGSSLTYALASQPLHGTLTGTAPNLTYKPTTGYVGACIP